MPPPINNAGSRAALVTWTVITSILFVVATVLAIFAQVERNRLTEDLRNLESKYDHIVSGADLTGPIVQDLQTVQAENEEYSSQRLLNIAVAQSQNLARLIAGPQVARPRDAVTAGTIAVDQLKRSDLKLPADNLVAALNAATAELKNRQQQVQQLETARTALQKQLNEINQTVQTQLKAKDAEIAAANAQVAEFQGNAEAYSREKDKQVNELRAQAEQAASQAREDTDRLQAQIRELEGKIKQQTAFIASLETRLSGLRLPVDQIVRQADARVIRLAGDDTLWIDVGSGNQVTRGMSFEVFDRIEGIPQPGDPTSDENLPRGKASIEIINVAPGTSECRIIRRTPGANIVEGDICVNVVFDRNIKYNFLVYGKFDLDRNGQATAQDADVIRRLVTSWGGRVVDQLDVDTDFLVVGKVPVIPEYTAEELDSPEKVYEVEQARKELDEFQDTIARAASLNIPVLNQNRFLYFTGYYEQAGR